MQFNIAFEGQIVFGLQCLDGAQCKCEGGKITFAHCRGAAKHLTIFNFSAVGGMRPTFSWRHDIAMRIQGNGFAACAKRSAHNEVGQGRQAISFNLCFRHWKLFCLVADVLQQLSGFFSMRCVVARWCVGRHLHQGLQKLNLLIEVGIDPLIKLLVSRLWGGHCFSNSSELVQDMFKRINAKLHVIRG